MLLVARQWSQTRESALIPAIETTQAVERQPEAEPELVEAAVANIATPAPPASSPSRGAGFRGRVIDAVTRQPVKAFEIQLKRIRREYSPGDQPISRQFKSQTGRFVWKDVEAGTWRAALSAPGYQMFNVDEISIVEGEVTPEIVIPLLHGFAVRGRVVESNTGVPIADAHISFRQVTVQEDFRKSRPHTRSKEDGSFVLDGVPAGDILLMVAAQNRAHRELPLFVDEKTPSQEIALSTGAIIAGIVITTSGAPIAGEVYLHERGGMHLGKTDEAGQFSFDHRPPGRYRLSANTSAGSATQAFILEQDEIKDGIVLTVGGGRSVRGMVKGLRPERLQEVLLVLHTKSSNTSFRTQPDASGSYALNGVPPGQAVMRIHGAGFEMKKPLEVPGDADVTLDITFPAGARLSGRITQDGKPAVQVPLWMRRVEDKSDVLYHTTTNADGSYEIEGLPAGDYSMRVHDDIRRNVTMAGDAVLNIDIPSVQLSARIMEESGAVPIVGATVYLRGNTPETASVHGDKQTDDFGAVALTGMEPGELVLVVYKPGYELYRETISYSSPITNKTIRLRKSAGVEVRIQPGSRRFPQGFTLTQHVPGSEHPIDLWMPLDRNGVCHVPSALAGTTFHIGRFSGEPIVFNDWDGQPFELP